MNQLQQLDLFSAGRLPHKPYYMREKGEALRIARAESALNHPYIQANPPALKFRIVFDVDRPGALHAWEDANVAPPNWMAENPANRHAHLGYEIEVPIIMTDSASMKPVRFAAAVETAYRDALAADIQYAGFICKNPTHSDWFSVVARQDPYDLPELAEYVDLSRWSDRRRKFEDYGVGRNCTVFEKLRRWSYGHVDEYRDQGTIAKDHWYRAVEDRALTYNADFNEPLHFQEIQHIARSVAKWTWRNFYGKAESDRRFSQKQAARGRRSGEARKAKAFDLAQAARLLKVAGKTNREVAEALNVHRNTVSNLLKMDMPRD